MILQDFVKISSFYYRIYVIADIDGDVWFFEEYISNKVYLKYTLSGKTVDKRFPDSAKLYCSLQGNEEISIFIEDIFTSKQGRGIETWMMNRFIEFVRAIKGIVKIQKIHGELLPDGEAGARKFFTRFGFEIKENKSGRKQIFAKPEWLKIVPVKGIEELEMKKIVKDWVCLKRVQKFQYGS